MFKRHNALISFYFFLLYLFQKFNQETFIASWIFDHNNIHLDEKNTYLTGNSDFTLKSLMTVNW